MIGAGKLDKRIRLLAPVREDNGLEVIETMQPVATVWAGVDYLSDTERFRAGAVNSSASVRFTIRDREVQKTWQVQLRNKLYAIDGIKPSSRGDAFLEITAGEVS
ncbi:phage head closure protein [Paracoccus sp. (in: a-proteobacteria)]|uniref:phage head closure protein n=1 Tax=Paracoccus sp. TaxID=267 RepID=UPI004059F6AD